MRIVEYQHLSGSHVANAAYQFLQRNFVVVCLQVGIKGHFRILLLEKMFGIPGARKHVWGTRCSVLIHLRDPLRFPVVCVAGYIYICIRDFTEPQILVMIDVAGPVSVTLW